MLGVKYCLWIVPNAFETKLSGAVGAGAFDDGEWWYFLHANFALGLGSMSVHWNNKWVMGRRCN